MLHASACLHKGFAVLHRWQDWNSSFSSVARIPDAADHAALLWTDLKLGHAAFLKFIVLQSSGGNPCACVFAVLPAEKSFNLDCACQHPQFAWFVMHDFCDVWPLDCDTERLVSMK